ncbi:MAG: acetamidase/formamidase family protein [Clostridia bacterium]|nr:acetamidase/formamidase family protein [Clostridia bacterium]
MSKQHFLSKDQFHLFWDESHKPVLTIADGDTVVMETSEVTNDFFTLNSTTEDIAKLDLNACYPLTGPIYVEGAQPGDTLAVEILDLKVGSWGWMSVLPGMGLLSDIFTEPALRVFDLSNGEYVPFREDIKVPFQPFLGTMGVCPKGAKDQTVMPPGTFGGNMDIRHLKKGATLYLPIEVEGALFSCGDGHAVQGDGEICVTAMECPLTVTLRFSLQKGKKIRSPQFFTPSPLTGPVDKEGYFATTGVNSDLFQAAHDATEDMVNHIAETYGLAPVDAYFLASLCVDLKICEIVDAGQYIVSAHLPLSVFEKK